MIDAYPNLPNSCRYPIGKAAKLLGIHRDTLRKKADDGLIKYGISRDNMRKFFLGSEINRYWKATY